MNVVFADTYYFFALLNPRDTAHLRAVEISGRLSAPIVTTAWVITEVADGLARSANRSIVNKLLQNFRVNPRNRFLDANKLLFDKGLALYLARLDKEWSLTDCISFVVMSEIGISDALTGDHHFQQAGFNALLA